MKMVESQQDNFNNINQINRRIENDDDETIEFAKTEKYPKKKPIFKIPNRFNKLKGNLKSKIHKKFVRLHLFIYDLKKKSN